MLLEQMGSSTGVHLREKGGKEHEVPCHYTLEKNLHEYLAAAEIAAHTKTKDPLFRTTGRKIGQAQCEHRRLTRFQLFKRLTLSDSLGPCAIPGAPSRFRLARDTMSSFCNWSGGSWLGEAQASHAGCVIPARLLARSGTTLPRRRRLRWLARRAHRPVRDVRR